ncbi:MAG: VWA domain-containing protein [Salinimicrobium sp.]
MSTTTLLLILFAFVLALALAWFQYFYKRKGKPFQNVIFAGLRFLSLFAVLLLIISPKLRKTSLFIEKPKLVLAVDNSSSIAYFGKEAEVKQLLQNFQKDLEIAERFEVEQFSFGSEVAHDTALDFSEKQSDISQLLKELGALYEQKIAPTVLITDGNQTVGEDFIFAARDYPQPVLPIVAGDTTKYRDLAISRVNANKYSFLKNRFPVEVFLNYSGKEEVYTRLKVISGNTTVYSKALSFRKSKNSEVLNFDLPSNSVGIHNYKVSLEAVDNEKNIRNNTKEFAVEVIDERTRVLIAYSIMHPDIGALKKAIESNEQRQVNLQQINESEITIEDYQLFILYQPDGRFKTLMEGLQQQNRNFLIVTGPKTDWNFLNEQQQLYRQEVTGQTEEFLPVKNENFGAFQIPDLDFSAFPPLSGNFGKTEPNTETEILLFRKIQGVETGEPLLSLISENSSKKGFLFGADIWRWRSESFLETGSFEAFDEFFGKLVQYLSSENTRDRLKLDYEKLYDGSEELVITAEYFDENYVFDSRAGLNLQLKNEETNDLQEIPFGLNANSYSVDLSNLRAGNYSFTVTVSGENLSKSGSFTLADFDVEEQFVRANLEGLQSIAAEKGQKTYFTSDFKVLKQQLLSDKSYMPVQKSRINTVSLIDWYYLLGVITISLSLEWFLRKYYGYI